MMKLNLKFRVLATAFVSLLVLGHLAWDHFHGGVPTHHLLADGDMPGISNWWGAIVLPLLTWFLLYRIQKRMDGTTIPAAPESSLRVALKFLSALLVGISISVFFTLEIDIIDYIMGCLFILAFFLPLYKSEYLLGFVLGSAFTFGAMLPTGFGSLLVLVFFLLYKATRAIFGYFIPKDK